ncbi:hypothetical protein B0G82_4234 [Paraburkholderia sp. BL17N1]|nr:hypothetical protein B0G82_4234 [Paraburkholderia sp. BL17N1]
MAWDTATHVVFGMDRGWVRTPVTNVHSHVYRSLLRPRRAWTRTGLANSGANAFGLRAFSCFHRRSTLNHYSPR